MSPTHVLLAASIAMAITTFLMLQTRKPGLAWLLVFLVGLSMAPVFPTILAITGTAFPHLAGTALGFVMTCGWSGLAVSSPIIGSIAGGDPLRLKKALLLIPGSAVLLIALVLAIASAMH
jgi:fucose permease